MKLIDSIIKTSPKDCIKSSFKVGRWFIGIFIIATAIQSINKNYESAGEYFACTLLSAQFFLITIPIVFLAIKYIIIAIKKVIQP